MKQCFHNELKLFEMSNFSVLLRFGLIATVVSCFANFVGKNKPIPLLFKETFD